jgi:hypothetical protein
MPIELPPFGLSSKTIGGWPRDFSTLSRREITSPTDSRSDVMFATVCGLSATFSTMSLRDNEPCRRMTSRTMRRL